MLAQHSVLIIDDVPSNIRVLAEALSQEYRLKVATNGNDGISIAQQTNPDLILLDVMMPSMDGFEVCRRLKSDTATSSIPVMFVTARDDFGDEERGLNLGAVDYITKPFHLPVVRARIRNQILLKQKTDLLERLAHVDGLTGVANRRRFDEALVLETRRCLRANMPISLLLVDIDHFKNYNDHFGHGMGDIALTRVATTLSQKLARAADLVARYGGEEFAVILPETDHEGATSIAEKLRESVAALNIPHAPGSGASSVSISVGVATQDPGQAMHPSELVEAADRRLYEAKATGRNRVVA